METARRPGCQGDENRLALTSRHAVRAWASHNPGHYITLAGGRYGSAVLA
ncbi:hypothetical protein OKW42_006725 [Paraburkholderia sp. WC7.3d]